MFTSIESPQRIAFVLNALTSGELTGGNHDVATVYSVLTDRDLGMCSPSSPRPIHECHNRVEFDNAFGNVLENWRAIDQLVFYFSGHGEIINEVFCIKVGISKRDYLPFDNILNDLSRWQVTRAIIVLDSCHSGKATGGIKSEDAISPIGASQKLPQGIAIVASSRPFEKSRELEDGTAGVFTHLFCKGIQTGLDGRATIDGYISVSDILDYVTQKLDSDNRFAVFRQRPLFSANGADRSIWLAKNRSGSINSKKQENLPANTITSSYELALLYEKTLSGLHPCINCGIDELDWKLIRRYSERVEPGLFDSSTREDVLSKLKLYSPILHNGEYVVHKSAVLCFALRPEYTYPQAKSIFVVDSPGVKNFRSKPITGPLSHQFEVLIREITEYLGVISHIGDNGLRVETTDIDLEVIRELISNAITHRDYESTGNIKITITTDHLEIQSPGVFPNNTSWTDFLTSELPVSCPINVAVSQYLSNLLTFEGIGRGFSLIRNYLKENGPESIIHKELVGKVTQIIIKRKAPNSTSLPEAIWTKITEEYNSKINKLYGSTRILGSSYPMSLATLYTDIYILGEISAHRRHSIEELNKSQPDKGIDPRIQRINGVRLVEQGHNLYILGKPGSGKTIFLKYIALIASKGLLPRVPIFISLNEYSNSNSADLISFIMNGFEILGVSNAHLKLFTEQLLISGNAIVLVDGLDEVKAENAQRLKITHELISFFKRYNRCQFLITSRTAANEYYFEGFREVEIADFTSEQIHTFARRWFSDQKQKYQSFIHELEKPENTGLKELCSNPLLLSMLCMAFDATMRLSPHRAEIYGDAIDILLRRWDSSRSIQRDEIYRGLSSRPKIQMYSWIAVTTFEKGNYFFHRRELEKYIADFLDKLPSSRESLEVDSSLILQSMESQDSIFVERAKDIYSFVHITLHEYFVARYIVDNQARGAVKNLIQTHLDDKRWREIILLTASMLDDASEFIREMKTQINTSHEEINDFLLTTAPDQNSENFNELESRADKLQQNITSLVLSNGFAKTHDLYAIELKQVLHNDRTLGSNSGIGQEEALKINNYIYIVELLLVCLTLKVSAA